MQSYENLNKPIYTDKFDFKTLLTGSLPTDEPLLKELGIDFSSIKQESNLVFSSEKIFERSKTDNTVDLIGPLVLVSMFAFAMALRAKLHFGYIYILCIFFTLGTYALLNLFSKEYTGLTFCSSILGYSFLPVCIFAWLNVFLWLLNKKLLVFIGMFFGIWSAYVASNVLCIKANISDKTRLVGFAIFLGYFSFIIMVIF